MLPAGQVYDYTLSSDRVSTMCVGCDNLYTGSCPMDSSGALQRMPHLHNHDIRHRDGPPGSSGYTADPMRASHGIADIPGRAQHDGFAG
jgi:hypothetical protein